MKKKLIALLAIFAVIIIAGVGVTKLSKGKNEIASEDDLIVVTSFYPMYILTANLAKDVPNVSVVNLTENQTGCLHDYQLTTKDMIELNSADLLVMNGGGMESFIENVITTYPDLMVVRATDGIELLPSTSEHSYEDETEEDHDHDHDAGEEDDHDHDHDADVEENHDADIEDTHDHDHGDYNAHVWMNMDYYLVEMKNVYQALVAKDPEHRNLYEANYSEYKGKVEAVKEEFETELANLQKKEIVIFHDAFAYLADEYGLEVIYTINLDDDTYLSAGEVKEIIDEVNLHGVEVLFTEEQYSDSIAESIAKETNASVYIIDSLVTGDLDLDSYLTGMENNLTVLKEALR